MTLLYERRILGRRTALTLWLASLFWWPTWRIFYSLCECLGPTLISLLPSCLSALSVRNTRKCVKEQATSAQVTQQRRLSAIAGASVGPQPGRWQPRSYEMRWDLLYVTSQVSCVCLHRSQKHCRSISHHGGADIVIQSCGSFLPQWGSSSQKLDICICALLCERSSFTWVLI